MPPKATAHAVTKGHVCVQGPEAVEVYVNVCHPCYQQSPCGCLGLLPGAMLMSQDCIKLALPLTWAAWDSWTW